jgi:hypothetical protein
MPQVTMLVDVDDCLGSTVIREYELDCAVDEKLMRRISTGGQLQFFPHFPRPFFKITKRLAYVIQGVFGNNKLRVTFSPSGNCLEEEKIIIDLIESQ